MNSKIGTERCLCVCTIFTALLLSGCALSSPTSGTTQRVNESIAHGDAARCGAMSFGEKRVGTRKTQPTLSDLSSGAPTRGAVLTLSEVSDHPENDSGKLAVLYLDRAELLVSRRHAGASAKQLPPSDAQYGAPKNVGSSEHPVTETTRIMKLSPAQIERLVCAANDFWTSNGASNFRADPHLLTALTVFRDDVAKDAGGVGGLSGPAATFSKVLWEIVDEINP